MSGTGPAADADGNIYVITGNGTFDTAAPRTNYGDSFIKLNPASGLSVADFFTPANQSLLDSNDFDVGSGGAIVLPDSAGSVAHPHLLIGGDKQGVLYVIDRDNMTGFNAGGDQILQTVPITAGPACIICGIFSTPAFWEGKLYVVAIGDVLKQYTVANAALSALPARQAKRCVRLPRRDACDFLQRRDERYRLGIGYEQQRHFQRLWQQRTGDSLRLRCNKPEQAVQQSDEWGGSCGQRRKIHRADGRQRQDLHGTQTELSVFGLLPN